MTPGRGIDMRNKRRLGGAILAAFLATLTMGSLNGRIAEAHANLVRSTPAAGAVLEQGPEYVEIEFSESIARAQSDIRVFNVRGERIDLDDLEALNVLTPRISLDGRLPEGTYTVAWNNLSNVDGHTRSGGFAFFIGEPALAPTTFSGDTPSPFLQPADVLARWGTLIGAVLLAGVPWTFGLVFASGATQTARPAIEERIRWITLVGGVIVPVAAVVQIVLKLTEVNGDAISLVVETRWGNAWLLRVVLTAAAVGIWWAGPRLPATQRRRTAVLLGLGAALTISLASHGAAAPDFGLVAGLIDAAHALATMAWGGGLVAFLVVLAHHRGQGRRDREPESLLRAALPRFSVLGAISTATLAITGAYAVWVNAGSLDALYTNYGRGIVVKVALLAVLVAIAAVNTTWVRHRLADRRQALRATSWLRRLVRVVVVLIALVLAVTGAITSMEPARQQVEDAATARGLVTTLTESGIDIEVTINPARVGPNQVTVKFERGGEPYDGVAAVDLQTRNLETAFGIDESFLSQDAPGRWSSVQPSTLTIDGLYEFALRVERDDGFDLHQSVRFDTTASRELASLDASRAWWVGLGVLGLLGATLIAANAAGGRAHVVRGEALGWIGAGVTAMSVLLISRVPEAALSLNSPIPISVDSIARGEAVYAANCVRCHGESLRGDGPDGATLGASDLTLHVPHHTDREHSTIIANGRGAMPPWEGVPTEDEIWHVINYLRATAEAASP